MGLLLNFLNTWLYVLAGVGALARTRWPHHVEYLYLPGGVGYMLKLAVLGYIELSNFIRDIVLLHVVGVARALA